LQERRGSDHKVQLSGGKLHGDSFRSRPQESPEVRRGTASQDWQQWLQNINSYVSGCCDDQSRHDGRPYIPVEIYGEIFLGLLDTGATLCVIGEKVADHVRSNGIKGRPKHMNLRMANGTKVDVPYGYKIEGKIEDRGFRCEAVAIKSLAACDIVVGMDVISDLRLVTFNTALCPRHGCCATTDEPTEIPKGVQAETTLSTEESRRLEDFLRGELGENQGPLGRTHLVEHNIKLKRGTKPIKQRYYPRNPAMQAIIDQEVESMLADGIIEPSHSGGAPQ